MNGLGQGGIDVAVQAVAGRIFDALLPQMKDIVARASVAAEPTVRSVVQKDVVPWVVLSVLAVGAGAAAIGSYMATRTLARRRARR